MKHKNRRTTGQVLSVLMGIFCFGLLALMLYVTQVGVSYQMQYDDAITELTKLRDQLAAQPKLEEMDQVIEGLLKNEVQQAALLLTDEEISNEKLARVAEYVDAQSAMMIFGEDGVLLYSFGNAETDPEFLRLLQEKQFVKTEDNRSFLAMRFRDDLYLAVGTDMYLTMSGYEKKQSDMSVVAEMSEGMADSVIVVNRTNSRVLYGPEQMIGRKLDNWLHLSEPVLGIHLLAINQAPMIAIPMEYEEYLLLSIFDVFTLLTNHSAAITPALFGFGFLIFLLLAYTEFIRTDMCRGRLGKIHYVQFGKKHYVNTLLLRKLVGFAMVGIACVICVVYCLQLLVRSDVQRQNAEHRLDIAARILEERQTVMEENEKQSLELVKGLAQDINNMFEINPRLQGEEGLNAIARLSGVDNICVLDEAGKTIAATSNFQEYEIDSMLTEDSRLFWNVINGFAESHVQVIPNDPYNQGRDMLYAAVASRNDRGMVMIAVQYNAFKDWQLYDTETALEMVGVDSQSTLLALRSGSTTCVFDSSNRYTGLPLDAYGIEEAFLRSGYSGTHQFDGQDCLITTRSVQDWHLLYLTPTGQISVSSWLFTAYVITIGLLVVIMAIIPRMVVRNPGEDLRKHAVKVRAARQRSHVDAVFDRDGQIELVESKVDQRTLRKRWRNQNANEKLSDLVRLLMAIIGVCLLTFLLLNRHTGNHPLIDRILARNWDQTLNVYAVSYVAIVVTGVWLIAEMMQNVTAFVTGTFSRRWKTSGILISNMIRYTTLIFSIFFTLKNFGVQTSSLATSASLLTLIFGLGCQNFVADLVAGIFLLFEGAFRVGDIVTIDNWHGEVVEIGLRSTKVKNEIGNVKVFQNSRISGAINMTRDQTYAVCDIPLPPGEMLEDYENKLTTSFFPEAMEKIEKLRHPLVYEGVVNMNGDNAVLRISVKCLEHDREQIKRELFRELKLWREQNAKKPSANA